MKYILRKLFFFTLLLLAPLAQAAKDTYTLSPPYVAARWQISHFGFSNKWHAKGTLVLDRTNLQNSKINVSFPVADIVTGIGIIDGYLKSKDFFDVNQFPTATFVSSKINIIDKNKAQAMGTLTLHGVSKPATLTAISNNPENPTVGFIATTNIKLSDFGLKFYMPGLGDKVTINIKAAATRV